MSAKQVSDGEGSLMCALTSEKGEIIALLVVLASRQEMADLGVARCDGRWLLTR